MVYYCSDYYGYSSNCNSAWYNWGRWVFAGAVVLFFVSLFVCLSCVRNRRRRRQGMAPMYGTGWMGTPGYNPNQPYNGAAPPYQPNPGYQPSPGYQQQQTGTYGNEGYYAPYGQGGVELQQPPHVYARAGDPVYDAPQGPPPTKGDGVIR